MYGFSFIPEMEKTDLNQNIFLKKIEQLFMNISMNEFFFSFHFRFPGSYSVAVENVGVKKSGGKAILIY